MTTATSKIEPHYDKENKTVEIKVDNLKGSGTISEMVAIIRENRKIVSAIEKNEGSHK